MVARNSKLDFFFQNVRPYLQCPTFHISTVTVLQKQAIRAVSKATYRAHTNILFKNLNILPFQSLIKYNRMSFMFDFVNLNLPSSFDNTWLTRTEVINNERILRTTGKYHIPFIPQSRLLKHPLYFIPNEWNDFDLSLKNLMVKSEFQSALKDYLLGHLDTTECADSTCYACTSLKSIY